MGIHTIPYLSITFCGTNFILIPTQALDDHTVSNVATFPTELPDTKPDTQPPTHPDMDNFNYVAKYLVLTCQDIGIWKNMVSNHGPDGPEAGSGLRRECPILRRDNRGRR